MIFLRIYNWLSKDYSHLDGRLRFLVYSILLYLGYSTFFNKIPDAVANCPNVLYDADGIIGLLFGENINIDNIAQFLYQARYSLVIAWVFAAIGFGGRVPIFITGILVFFFYGFYKGTTGTGHGWHLPMYALFIYGFFLKPDRFSVDWYLSKYFKNYLFKPCAVNDTSGIGTKLILIAAVYTLFAAGIAKIFHSGGFGWLTGSSLYFYLENFSAPKGEIGRALYDFLINHPLAVTILSIWTVVFEVGAILMLFFPRTRIVFIVNAMCFHIGIFLLMIPAYFPQMTIYLLLINWNRLNFKFLLSFKTLPKFIFSLKAKSEINDFQLNVNQKFISVIFIVFISSLVYTIVKQEEHYPLTHVPMYSNYADKERIGHAYFVDFENIEGLKKIARNFCSKESPWYMTFYFPKRLKVVAHLEGEEIDYTSKFSNTSFIKSGFVWNHRVTKSFFNDVSNNDGLEIDQFNFTSTSKLFDGVCEKIFKDDQRVLGATLMYNLSQDIYVPITSFHRNNILLP